MVSRDPLRVVSGSGRNGATGSFDGRCLDLLRCSRWLFGGLSRLALLREVRRNPDGVEEVGDASDTGQEEKVKEQAGHDKLAICYINSHKEYHYSHVRVEDAGLRLHNANSSIMGVDGKEIALSVGDNRGQGQSQVLRVHLVHEAVAQFLLLTSRDLDTVSRGGQVANHGALLLFQSRQSTTDKVHRHWGGFAIGD